MEIIEEVKKVKKYKVLSKNIVDNKEQGRIVEEFTNLLTARRNGREHYRANRFIKLTNAKGIVLAL